VLVWRDEVLPLSETFVAAQLYALKRWRGFLGGRVPTRLAPLAPPDLVLYPRARLRAGRALARALPWPGERRLDRFIKGNEIDLVHVHFLDGALRVLGVVARAGVPLVVTAHGYDVTTDRARARDYRALFDYAAVLIAVSEFIKERLLELGAPESKIAVRPIGIAVRKLSDAERALRDCGILFVGRLVEKKGLADLLAALDRLPAATSLRVIGDGVLRGSLEKQAQSCRAQVTFLGAQPASVVWEEMLRASVFCAPSRRASDGSAEGLPMVLLEAAAAELPTVVCRSGGTPEAIVDGETGLLCPEGDIEALAAALARLLADPSLGARLGRAGRERVIAKFDLAARTEALELVYDAAVDGGGLA